MAICDFYNNMIESKYGWKILYRSPLNFVFLYSSLLVKISPYPSLSLNIIFHFEHNDRLSSELKRNFWATRKLSWTIELVAALIWFWVILCTESPPHANFAITTWWRHQMKTFSALLSLCPGNSPVKFPSQRPVTRSFVVFFDLRLNKRLSKQSRRRWFETQSSSLWRHCNE